MQRVGSGKVLVEAVLPHLHVVPVELLRGKPAPTRVEGV
jgi:hypothetical protein